MELYRQLWTVLTTVLTITGLWIALGTWALADVVVVFVLVAVVSTLWLWAFRELSDAWAWSIPRGTVFSAVVVGTGGLTAGAGLAATASMVALGAFSPTVLRLVLREPQPECEPQLLVAEVPALDRLGDLDLCRLWRETYLDLLETSPPDRHMHLVRLRESALQELERRHPDAVRAWLASDPPAAGDPSHFLNRPRSNS